MSPRSASRISYRGLDLHKEGGGNFIEICGDLAHDEGVRDAVEAVFSDLVLACVVGVEWVCADVFWQ